MWFGAVEMLILSFAVFWVWMLIDCLLYMPRNSVEKLTWVVVIVFTSIVGALAYCLTERRARLAT